MRHCRAVLALLLLASCGAPPADLYVLQAKPGAEITTRPVRLELRRIGLAGYLDRPEIVLGPRDYRLSVDSAAHWAEPLGRMLGRVLTENLVQRLPEASVFAESGAISTRPDLVLEIDIQRLDLDANGTLVLVAQTALRPDGGAARVSTQRLLVPAVGPTPQSDAAAISLALAELADRLAQQVQ